jgi:hypothetical protein
MGKKSKPIITNKLNEGSLDPDGGIAYSLELPGGILSIHAMCEGEKCIHFNSHEYNSKQIYYVFLNNPELKKMWPKLWKHFKRFGKEDAEPYETYRDWMVYV